MEYEPPFLESYKSLLQSSLGADVGIISDTRNDKSSMVERCELPLIDLCRLSDDHFEREECMKEIIGAARTWGFFQVVNHGVPQELLRSLQYEQMKVFRIPFASKSQKNFLNLPARSYRWGNPFATNLSQISWSEAFHMFLPDIAKIEQHQSLRSSIEAFASVVAPLAETLVHILAQKLNIKFSYFQENCSAKTSFLRLNRYPPCPFPSKVFGLLPHSDSSFLTIVHQDHIGGLQLMKDGIWFGIKPNPAALVINIGDLFQALSNDIYKSARHRVVAAEKVERFSVAYFFNPSKDAVIESQMMPSLYRKFTFGEYKEQTEKDVKETGDKVGLSRFLLHKQRTMTPQENFEQNAMSLSHLIIDAGIRTT
ncbi:gibberellin 2-beta-dioxygenase 8-like [Abrus precatorius]|uniref:gibberellin 2beta-dioxygenase n=1 Tax=Abrus precatorius TaxID=3816 RepID=A0A8B8KHK7_ABRPR|nr:gibberellin 2-beta-dioxygenase 8-like [Abrus precatorius]